MTFWYYNILYIFWYFVISLLLLLLLLLLLSVCNTSKCLDIQSVAQHNHIKTYGGCFCWQCLCFNIRFVLESVSCWLCSDPSVRKIRTFFSDGHSVFPVKFAKEITILSSCLDLHFHIAWSPSMLLWKQRAITWWQWGAVCSRSPWRFWRRTGSQCSVWVSGTFVGNRWLRHIYTDWTLPYVWKLGTS